jgi:ferredoxin-NADP reductase
MPSPWQAATIAAIAPATPRIVSVFLQVDLGRHEAGQHVDVRLTAEDGYSAQRSYSIASAPGADRLELAIERLADGEVSPYFHDVAQPGDRVDVRGPIGGHFVWRPQDGGPLLLIGAGSGAAPLMAIWRERAERAPEVPVLMLVSARTAADLLWRDELAAAAHGSAAFVVTTTRAPRWRSGDYERRLDAPLIGEILARWGQEPALAYVCGSHPFVETAAGALQANGVAAAHIRTERYGASG